MLSLFAILALAAPPALPVAPPPRELYRWVDYGTGQEGWYARDYWEDGVLKHCIHEADWEFSYILPRAEDRGELP